MFELSGDGLPWSLRYEDEMQALGYAAHKLAATGGRVHFLDRRGFCHWTEVIDPPDVSRSWYPAR